MPTNNLMCQTHSKFQGVSTAYGSIETLVGGGGLLPNDSFLLKVALLVVSVNPVGMMRQSALKRYKTYNTV